MYRMEVFLKDGRGEFNEMFKTVYSLDETLALMAGQEISDSLKAVVRVYDCDDEHSPSKQLVKEIKPNIGG